ncbi:MAG: leucyl aminopeptidase [Desulfuromonas sp.]|nr:MAG: leucyl aminopeptidase [Desulfuromonas sp.]
MLNISVKSTTPLRQKTSCLVYGVQEGKLRTDVLSELDEQLHGVLQRAKKDGEFKGGAGQSLMLHGGKGVRPERILLVGLGKGKELTLEAVRQAVATALGQVRTCKLKELTLDLASFAPGRATTEDLAQGVAEGLLLANYRFEQFLAADKNRPGPLQKAVLLVRKKEETDAESGAARAAAICRGACTSRDLVNQPGNVKSPEYLADEAKRVAEETGLQCRILDRAELEKEKCGALLGVAQGSSRDPRMIILQHNGGAKGDAPIALVGKGVVFDAGGISLKPAEKMDEMKMDMAGGAAVIGAMQAAALLQLPLNLVGIVPAVENLPSGTAYRPGDILTSMSGKTIEVLNTDAEGRLILADALTYVARFEPKLIIDLATLTGACIIALGNHAAAVLGDDGLARQLMKAGESCGERVWQLPLWDDYAKMVKSHVADIKNVGGRGAGTITAAAFLQAFAKDQTWAHLDIAGTAWEGEGKHYLSKGGTGFGVRLLIEFLRGQA